MMYYPIVEIKMILIQPERVISRNSPEKIEVKAENKEYLVSFSNSRVKSKFPIHDDYL